jgi:hypothetical protein
VGLRDFEWVALKNWKTGFRARRCLERGKRAFASLPRALRGVPRARGRRTHAERALKAVERTISGLRDGWPGRGHPHDSLKRRPYYGCTVVAGAEVADSNTGQTCDPSDSSHLAPFATAADVTPSHEGTLSTGVPGSEAEITINGDSVTMEFAGDVEFFLDNCVISRPYTQCDLGLRVLDLAVIGSPVFGDYQVNSATLSLAHPETTTVDFVCNRNACGGDFAFLASVAPLGMNLNWEQKTLSTGRTGGGGMLLSHGPGGLGGISTLNGHLELDVSMSTGTIQLVGSGNDAYSGNLASTTFDLRGTVDRL